MPELRDYQVKAVEDLRASIVQHGPRVLLESPTGSGKTLVAAELIRSCDRLFKRSLFLAPRRELIKQCSNKLNDFNVPHGLLMAGMKFHEHASVQVASKSTVCRRGIAPYVDLCVIDEAHLSMAPEWFRLLTKLEDVNPQLVTVGLTATPSRASGRGLGAWYQSMVKMATYKALQEQGFLVPVRVYAPDVLDLRKIRRAKTITGYDTFQLERACMTKLVGNVVEHWKKLAKNRPTVVFASSVKHSKALMDQFNDSGISAAHIDMKTPTHVRDEILSQIPSNYTVVCNYDILTLGWDCPPISCVVNAAPGQLVRFRQKTGRALRPYPNKTETILIDHTGGVYVHGFPDEDIEWQLNEGDPITAWKKRKDRERSNAEGSLNCPKCFLAWRPPPAECPICGWYRPTRGDKVAVQKGLLKEVGRFSNVKPTKDPKWYETHWMNCLYAGAAKGYKCSQLVHMFKNGAGCLPWKAPGKLMLPGPGRWDLKITDAFPTLRKKGTK